jgi:predicted nucleotidyltransferase
MTDGDRRVEKLIASLQERAKELNCLYEVEQICSRPDLPLAEVFQKVVDAIPPGWQYPDVCCAMVQHGDRVYTSSGFRITEWAQATDITVQDRAEGRIVVCYLERRPREDVGPFLKEEERLIRTIAERLSHYVLFQRLHNMHEDLQDASRGLVTEREDKWRGPVELLRRSDRKLYLRIARKMVNHLCWAGVEGAQELLREAYGDDQLIDDVTGELNVPGQTRTPNESILLSGTPFELASSYLDDDEVLSLIQSWMVEDKASFLPKVLNNPRSSLSEIIESLRRFHHLMADGGDLPHAILDSLRVSLIRRFLTEQLGLIGIAKQFLHTDDFLDLLDRVIVLSESHGRLGGKSAGLWLAEKILRKTVDPDHPIGEFKVPRSWYIASEEIMNFIEYNDLEEVLQQKYRDISQVRHEYPNIVQLFKNSQFPPDLVRSISMLLDDAGEAPLIVRSSSLLEDQLGSAFSGKYKSLFLANQGSKQERLAALLDAITEVYASLFGPDPIAYRREKGLIDFHEEMAILVQEVVGKRIGDYFLPAAGGVAFSKNEFRWSPRINRSDGLIRLVPGLGTRAVDRISNDYPILAVPGQPSLRVNPTIDEVVRYSPQQVDVLNLATSSFETVDLETLVKHTGSDFPAFELVFSVLREDGLKRPVPLLFRPDQDRVVADFNGLITETPFIRQVGSMLKILERQLGTPVDIEFAFDGDDFYLLQCRPQSYSDEAAPAPIPKDIPDQDIVFLAKRYVSNGWVPDISHVVYVSPEGYASLGNRNEMLAVGKAVGRLNKLLPKRKFILMGPGRWGSRGDIKLGVSVTYADINNTAVLVEIARKTGNYLPDLSFGTHFFQDLVESSIRYLPLYPDDDDGSINERFLLRAPNLLPEMLPEYERLADVLRVIDVPSASDGRILRVLMNSDLDRAVGMLARPETDDVVESRMPASEGHPRVREQYWRWRMRMAERIAAEIDPRRFGVRAVYLIGSTKNASAGPSSDIDLLIHVGADEQQRHDLEVWLKGWSLCLGEMNYLRTGYQTPELLDVHFVTDEDLAARTSFAAKIDAVTDAAVELPLSQKKSKSAKGAPD